MPSNLTHDDFVEIQRVCDDRYVMQSDCNERQEANNKKFANDDKRIDIISHDFKVIKWLVTTVAASSIGALVVAIMELVIK